MPVILVALLNVITLYKMRKISKSRFVKQVLLWSVILLLLLASFPVYNHLSGRSLFDSTELSSFDIAETTAIIYLFYIVNNFRRKIEYTERRLRDLHQELSILLSR